MSTSETTNTSNANPQTSHRPSLLRSSALMASGTMLSRILGFVRTAMLAVAIGAGGGGVSAAFTAANSLPNMVYNVLAAGVFDAVLVPQIIRAMRKKNGQSYVNKLITLAGFILFIVTIITLVLSPLLVMIFSSGFDSETRALAILFSLLCLPQIFFYGIYNLLGEFLNAHSVFGPYMWAPVLNNIISIAGIGAFITLWGSSGEVFPIQNFTSPQYWLLAGSATAGVIMQALILIIPIKSHGLKLRADCRFRGTNFSSASKVAIWTFLTLGVSQIGIISTSNIQSYADGWAKIHEATDIAGGFAGATTFMVFMVPQSLVTVSLATAIFTRIANSVANRDNRAAANDYHLGVQIISMINLLAAAIIMVASIPIMQIVMPRASSAELVSSWAWVLVAYMPGVASTGMLLMSQRLFYAYEDAKPVFIMGVAPTIIQIIVGWSLFALTDVHWWVVGAAAAETIGRIIHGFIAIFFAAHRVHWINPGRLIASYFKYLISVSVSGAVAFTCLFLINPYTATDSHLLTMCVAAGKLISVTIIVLAVYITLLHFVDPANTSTALGYITARIPFLKKYARDTSRSTSSRDNGEVETEYHPVGGLMKNNNDAGESLADAQKSPSPSTHNISTPQFEPDISRSGEQISAPENTPVAAESAQNLDDSHPQDIENTGSWRSIVRSLHSPVSSDIPESPIPLDANFSSVSSLSDFDKILQGSDAASISPANVPPVDFPANTPESSNSRVDEHPLDTHEPSTPLPAADIPQNNFPEETPSLPSSEPVKKPVQPPSDTHVSAMGESDFHPPKSPLRRGINPSIIAIILACILVFFAASWAIKTAFGSLSVPSISLHPEASGSSSAPVNSTPPETTLSPTQTPQSTPKPAPEISNVQVFGWRPGSDFPENAARMTDGDPNTSWTSWSYDVNQFPRSQTVTILLTFKEETDISRIKLTMPDGIHGGQLVVNSVSNSSDPRSGDILVRTDLKPSTIIELPKDTHRKALSLSFFSMPRDAQGRAQATISEISVE